MRNAGLGRLAVAAAIAVVVSACGGGGGGTAATVAPPSIASQPASAAVLTDGSATFTVNATGEGLSYQWRRNGVDIAGATAATYTAPAASFSDSGAEYTVVVSNAGGTVTSSPAQLTLTRSASQQAFESLYVAPSAGAYWLRWNLNSLGPQVSGVNYAYSDSVIAAASPLTNGPQTARQTAPRNLAATLALVSPGPTRVLKNGAILVAPNTDQSSRYSYVGSDVRLDSLAADNMTVAYSSLRTNEEIVALTGTMSGTSPDFARFHNSFFTNPVVLNAAAPWGAGSSYSKFTMTNLGDRYNVQDCAAVTVDANVSACFVGTTLTTALNTGITASAEGITYHLGDGTLTTVDGVQVWVAHAPLPQSFTLSNTPQYRMYFALNGNVYRGTHFRDGAPIGGSYYISNPAGATVLERLTFLPFNIRMNKAAHVSMSAAVAI